MTQGQRPETDPSNLSGGVQPDRTSVPNLRAATARAVETDPGSQPPQTPVETGGDAPADTEPSVPGQA
jgi:hypothetical protein